MTSQEAIDSFRNFYAANNIQVVSSMDHIFKLDDDYQSEQRQSQRWRDDPHYFKKVMISATALIKIVMHAHSGKNNEVMGMLQGKLLGDTIVVLDVFEKPSVGSEVRVNASGADIEYMSEYMRLMEVVGRQDVVVGWYHSHPGYGCWLSGVDVKTQEDNQKFQDPFLAIVIDPKRTMAGGKVEIGAFRTYPENYKPPNADVCEYQSIPLDKIEDFGVHSTRYYQLEIIHFKSSLDTNLLELLWNKYWINTLSSSPMISNREYNSDQVVDLANKVEQGQHTIVNSFNNGYNYRILPDTSNPENDTAMSKICKDSSKIAIEHLQGLMTEVIKHSLFNPYTININ